ncbi:Flp pilus assembly protein CpaB [Sphingomonas sp. 7/4-4]|jgi:pilus assembly protein CpaB|uniref:Flp pilus assembly protein CpaB n=1 Tax=Sphingomonas sp. 7/4-4 TaxID=3018446 RepID=UPI0022F3C92F|nr:Flp pilus assembly protein CpaB [Sphingomonas sp. 7/4-4]WBY09603.1 Flp pilus assembly protein CpaB [Sphingomonas sp. 7/4-4]
MDARKLILLVGALVVAAITAFMARNILTGASAPVANAIPAAAPQNTTEVMVATRSLPVGTILDATSVKFVAWPKELIEGAYYIKGESELAKLQGTVVRFAIPAGQPITQGALVKPGDRGFLAAALGPGMRAVTVPVSAQSAVAGFIFPGDRVDLMLTQSVSGGGDGPPLKASETILRNLRVLATDQKTDKTTDDKGNTVVTTYSNVTVEATPKIAEKIAVAQTVGQLSLSLRSIADNQSDLEQAIANGDVDVPADGDPKKEKEMMARVAARPMEGAGGFATGADVSRFQRSTVPGKPVDHGTATSPVPGNYPGGVAVRKGSVVTVARGNSVTETEVGGKN